MTRARATENLLGFDFGTRSIGVAVGNTLTGTAHGLTTVANSQQPDWSAIRNLVQEWQPAQMIIGLPLNMDGTEQPLTIAARKFAEELERRFNITTQMMDERLSSVEARAALKAQRAGGRKSRIRSGEKDSEAARVILTDWLALQ